MDLISPLLTWPELFVAALVGVVAGFVKGVVGFAMPLVFISGLTTFIAPEVALAGLILPTLVTNIYQAFRQGVRVAWQSTQRFWIYLVVGGVFLLVAAQFVRLVSEPLLQLAIGVPVTLFALIQLWGFQLKLTGPKPLIEGLIGAIAGVLAGFSGIWGPPTVMYLTAINTPKADQMRAQGVIYGLGAIALAAAHLWSGVLNEDTIGFSVAMIFPGALGMWIGTRLSDRIDQTQFRRATLVVLIVAGANLIRRGMMG